MTQDHPVTLEVRALEGLGLEALRAAWGTRYGAPPKLRSPELLAHLLAWRIQTEAFGGLDAETAKAVRRSPSNRRTAQLGPRLGAGMKLAREWRGVRHEVEVIDGAFRYQGATYKSLSVVAQAITGVRWNGPRFFGLRQGAAG